MAGDAVTAEALLLDLDGTLVDSDAVVERAGGAGRRARGWIRRRCWPTCTVARAGT